MMVVAHAWAAGSKFSDLCKLTDVFEGSIIRCMRRLEEMLRQMCSAAKAIGNTELETKFAEGECVSRWSGHWVGSPPLMGGFFVGLPRHQTHQARHYFCRQPVPIGQKRRNLVWYPLLFKNLQ
jgi:hypothetical protein